MNERIFQNNKFTNLFLDSGVLRQCANRRLFEVMERGWPLYPPPQSLLSTPVVDTAAHSPDPAITTKTLIPSRTRSVCCGVHN